MDKLEKLEVERAKKNFEAVQKLREYFGSNAKMAEAIELDRQHTAGWDAVPLKYVRALARVTGWPINDILPDPFPHTPTERTPDGKEKVRAGRPKKAR